MSATGHASDNDDYYSVLGLPRPRNDHSLRVTKDEIKAAYRHTLLMHHPDKLSSKDPDGTAFTRSALPIHHYSVDQIVQAYQTLSNPTLRAVYDEKLNKEVRKFTQTNLSQGIHLGVEVYDLDDLDYNESTRSWSRSCRCASDEGYVLTETELEKESKAGEIYVGCRGCSLFIKVLFGVMEDAVATTVE